MIKLMIYYWLVWGGLLLLLGFYCFLELNGSEKTRSPPLLPKPTVIPLVPPNFDFNELSTDTPIDTKLDLIRAYIDMGENTLAKRMLQGILQQGNLEQQEIAKRLLEEIA